MEEVRLAEGKKIHALEYRGGLLRMSGVKDVKSFDDKEAIVVLDGKTLTVKGHDLTITELRTSDGNFSVSGEVLSVTYTRGKSDEGILKKLFK